MTVETNSIAQVSNYCSYEWTNHVCINCNQLVTQPFYLSVQILLFNGSCSPVHTIFLAAVCFFLMHPITTTSLLIFWNYCFKLHNKQFTWASYSESRFIKCAQWQWPHFSWTQGSKADIKYILQINTFEVNVEQTLCFKIYKNHCKVPV